MRPTLTSHEAARLDALHAYTIDDAGSAPEFDDLTALAAEICGAPTAFISMVDEMHIWFKAKVGSDQVHVARGESFCAHAILTPQEIMVVTDPTSDPRFMHMPFVAGPNGVRFYAGVPLLTPEGLPIGTLCVLDQKPRTLDDRQLRALRILSREVMTHFELRRKTAEFQSLALRYRGLIDSLTEGVLIRDGQNRLRAFNPSAEQLFRLPLQARVGHRELGLVGLVQENGEPMDESQLPGFGGVGAKGESMGLVFGLKTEVGITWFEGKAQVINGPAGSAPVGIISSFWDITENKNLRDRLQQQATHDTLTGLPNRRALEARLPLALASAARHGTPLSLCLCDLDHFKQVNDQLGHAAGDKALRQFAQTLQACLRQEDLPIRLGGDEFCVLFEGTSALDAQASLDRIRSVFAFSPGAGLSPVTASFGVTDWRPGMNLECLLASADEALYEAKTAGRNRVHISPGPFEAVPPARKLAHPPAIVSAAKSAKRQNRCAAWC